jgi:transcriptional regulator with XRE-family HTH domain
MDLRRGLARSLRLIRKTKGIAQEQLSDVSGRTYLSEIERGIKNPTVEKIDVLARAMKVHPLTVLAIAYLGQLRARELEVLLDGVTHRSVI